MNTLKKLALTGAVTALTLENTFADTTKDPFGNGKVSTNTGTTTNVDVAIQALITNALTILGLVAVVYGIYGGFLMTTAGGDEEKVKKGRTIMTQVAIGLVVIFLANSIVRWFLGSVINVTA